MPTLTIRKIPETVVQSLKEAARRHGHSMEQEVRDMLMRNLSRRQLLDAIRESWKEQRGTLTAEEIEAGMQEGRP
jgi:plasmid stability protein